MVRDEEGGVVGDVREGLGGVFGLGRGGVGECTMKSGMRWWGRMELVSGWGVVGTA